MKSLRTWIITIIVMIFVYEAYIVCGYAVPSIANFTGISIDIIRAVYNDAEKLLFAVLVTGFLMVGLLVKRQDADSGIVQWIGRLLISYGAIELGWQVVRLVAYHSSWLIWPWLTACESSLTALLMCASLILIGYYYRCRDMLGLAIGYAVTDLIFVGHFVWSVCAAPTPASYHAYFSIFATAALILKLIFLFKWAKLSKPQYKA